MTATTTAIQTPNIVSEFSRFMDKFKPQMALALPKHLTADRMARLALTAFSSSPQLQLCTANSIAASIMMASTLGLEPGVNGQGFLIPYKATCTFVPGWKGLVDIANRSGRSTVWTGAVFEGDEFDYALGDSPFVRHRPGDEDDPELLTHVYAIGRVNGSNHPVIEVWTMRKVWNHRDKYNKVGARHYSFRDPEMYARKVPLLQVLKYLPSSVELNNAITAATAAESGRGVIIDGNIVTLEAEAHDDTADQADPDRSSGKPNVRTPQPRAAAAQKASAPPPGWDPDVPPPEGSTAVAPKPVQATQAAAPPAPAAAAQTSSTTSAPAREPSGPGVLASEGEKKLIINRARNNSIALVDLLNAAGLEGLPPDLAGLTKDGFIALKDQLPAAA